jgi:acyl-[acyl-carrier-protein]-phospholipid O-acyltransferase/long-chain-fatty-acid--[acyl-carrier-protein] ligase
MCGVLPFFHSFGFLGTLWYPLLSGIPVAYHPNPLDARAIGKLVEGEACTMLLGTPTFLQAYMKRIARAQFASLRTVIAGAERLRPELAEAFYGHFGVRPLEGYGATELAPVAALNVPDQRRRDGALQTGHKPGTVGHAVPGVVPRVVDPDTGEPLPPGVAGRLQIRGPNVMLGYLDDPDRTQAVIRDGWYDTGDIACIDAEGFIAITGRLSRFSKIGGEMVPHEAVEDALLEALGTEERVLAVASRPDPKRGERLVVLATPAAGDLGRLRELLSALPLPNLWRPAPGDIREIPELPLLGTGKVDLKALQRLAGEDSSEADRQQKSTEVD